MGDEVYDAYPDAGGFGEVLLGGLDRVLQYEAIKAQGELNRKPLNQDVAPWYVRDGSVYQAGKAPTPGAAVPAWMIAAGLGAVALVAVLLVRR